ncbi:MAG: hypothetical protein AAB599_03885 [Patescibacteria group bacterium]
MHAFIVVGKTKEERNTKVQELLKKQKVEITIPLEQTNNAYSIKSIRELTHTLSLKSPEIRAIIIFEAQKMTEEAGNAFLKTLEEPHGNTIYILTAPARESVLETISSRCEVINLGASTVELSEEEKEGSRELFEKLSSEIGKWFKFVDKISDREEALQFVVGQIWAAREKLLESTKNESRVTSHESTTLLNHLLQTKRDLEQNVNVKLTLTELLLHY